MAYDVGISRKVQKQLDKLPERVRERILEAAFALSDDPRPQGARKMRGTGNLEEWRIRVGEAVILEAGHRQGIYG
jgi:mRNA interferase RelE/StbE